MPSSPPTSSRPRRGKIPRRLPAIVLCLALLGSSVPPTGALAGAPPFPVTLSVAAGPGLIDPLGVTVRSAEGARCALNVQSNAGPVRRLPAKLIGRAGSVAWHWNVSGTATDVPWRFTATCTLGRLWSARWLPVELGFGATGAALGPAGAVGAGTRGASCDAQGLCFADDPFPVGQCTWYAAGLRPDLLGIVHGNAGSWLAEARGRVAEGSLPVAGSLAVWRPHHGVAGTEGHVAYVVRVTPAGRALVDDSNWVPTPGSSRLQVHEHWISADAPSGYIYGGPAGVGP